MRALWTAHRPKKWGIWTSPSSFSGDPSPSVWSKDGFMLRGEGQWTWEFIKCAEENHQALNHSRGHLPSTLPLRQESLGFDKVFQECCFFPCWELLPHLVYQSWTKWMWPSNVISFTLLSIRQFTQQNSSWFSSLVFPLTLSVKGILRETIRWPSECLCAPWLCWYPAVSLCHSSAVTQQLLPPLLKVFCAFCFCCCLLSLVSP